MTAYNTDPQANLYLLLRTGGLRMQPCESHDSTLGFMGCQTAAGVQRARSAQSHETYNKRLQKDVHEVNGILVWEIAALQLFLRRDVATFVFELVRNFWRIILLLPPLHLCEVSAGITDALQGQANCQK